MWIVLGVLALVVVVIAVRDLTQRRHALTRNFPVIGHFRYLLEEMGQPLRQYFFAGDLDERPYNRVTRSWVYASAKGQNNMVGFGSQVDHDAPGRMHIVPSMYATLKRADATDADLPRPRVIGARRPQPYQPRRFANISGMSYGALSANSQPASSRARRYEHLAWREKTLVEMFPYPAKQPESPRAISQIQTGGLGRNGHALQIETLISK